MARSKKKDTSLGFDAEVSEQTVQNIEKAAEATVKAGNAAEKTEKKMKGVNKETEKTSQEMNNMSEAMQNTIKSLNALADGVDKFVKSFSGAEELLTNISTALNKFNSEEFKIKIDNSSLSATFQKISDVKEEINSLKTAMNRFLLSDRKDGANSGFQTFISSLASNVRSAYDQLFSPEKPIAIKVNLQVDKKAGKDDPINLILGGLKRLQELQLPFDTINQLIDKLEQVRTLVQEIMTGLRLDSTLSTGLLKNEIENVDTELGKYKKQIDKLNEIRKKLGTDVKRTTKLGQIAGDVYTQNKNSKIVNADDVQKLEGEILKYLQLGGQLSKATLNTRNGATNYLNVVRKLFSDFDGLLKERGNGGLKDYLNEFFNYEEKTGKNGLSYIQITGQKLKSNIDKLYSDLEQQKKNLETQLRYATDREKQEKENAERASQFKLEKDSADALAKALTSAQKAAQDAGEATQHTAELNSEQLKSLTNQLDNLKTVLDAIKTSVEVLSSDSQVIASLSKLDLVSEQSTITDFTNELINRNQTLQQFLDSINASSATLLDTINSINGVLNESFSTKLQEALTNFPAVSVNIQPNITDIVTSFINPITEAVKGTPVEIEIKPIINKFITDLRQTIKGLNAKEIISNLQNTISGQSKSIKVNVIPSDAKGFIKALQDAIDALNKPVKIKVEPIVKSFIKDITTAIEQQKKNTVGVHLTPIVDKTFKDELQQKINTQKIKLGLIPDVNNIQDFIDKLQNAITLANKPIKVKVEPILKDFIKRCEEILANQAVNVNFRPQNAIGNNNSGKTVTPFTNKEMQELLALETNASSRTTTNVVNGKIISGKVVSNIDGKERTYVVDQYGNEKITERTADKVTQQQRANTKQLEEEYRKLINDGIKKLEDAYHGLIKTEKDYLLLQERIKEGQQLTPNQQAYLSQLQLERQDYQNVIDSIHLLDDSLDSLKQKYSNVQSTTPNIVSDLIKNEYIDDTIRKVEKLKELVNSGKYTGVSTKAAQEYLNKLPDIKTLDLDTIKKYNLELDNLFNNTLKKAGNETKLQKLLNNITNEMQKNSAMSKKLTSDFEQLKSKVQTLLSSGNYTPDDIKALTNEFIALDTELIKSGKIGKSFFKTLGDDIKSSSARMISYYASFHAIIRYIRSMISAVSDLDKTLNTLQIVSNATQGELKSIADTSHKMAQELGSTTTEIVSSITEWRRLGKTLEESKILAEQATKLATGGIMDISSATTALVSSMQAFDLEADEINKVVDQYIYLGKEIAL